MPNQAGIQRRAAIVDFIRGYTEENGFSPTIDEIREGSGLSSKSAVLFHLLILEKEGVVRHWAGRQRAISLVGTTPRGTRERPKTRKIAAVEAIDLTVLYAPPYFTSLDQVVKVPMRCMIGKVGDGIRVDLATPLATIPTELLESGDTGKRQRFREALKFAIAEKLGRDVRDIPDDRIDWHERI